MTVRASVAEEGFTLVEMVVAMTISSVVMGGVVAAFIVGVNTTGAASTRLGQSNDRELLEIWLPRDATSAQSATTGATAGCTAAGGKTAVLILQGSGVTVTTSANGPSTINTDSYEADYVLVSAASGKTLYRYFCDPTDGAASTIAVGSNLASASASVPAAGETGLVSLTLTDQAGNTYTVSGLERS